MKNHRRGFTLVEIMLSIVLIAIAAIAGLAFLVFCDRFAMKADSRIMAANFAREKMEDLYMCDCSDSKLDIPAGKTTTGFLPDPNPLPNDYQGFIITHPQYAPARTYAVSDDAGSYAHKVIAVTMGWNQ